MKILILGGTGLLGHDIVKYLSKKKNVLGNKINKNKHYLYNSINFFSLTKMVFVY